MPFPFFLCKIILMKRFLGLIDKNFVRICDDENVHLRNVLRLKAGDEIITFNGDGFDYICQIISVSKNETLAKILKKIKCQAVPKNNLTLCMASVKREKIEQIVQKAVELGCKKLIIFEAERSNTKIKEEKFSRYEKIIISACKQCERADIMELQFQSFDEMLSHFAKSRIRLFANERNGQTFDLNLLKDKKDISILVGCEGGFTDGEIKKILALSPENISLGKRILRAETAAILLLGLAGLVSGN